MGNQKSRCVTYCGFHVIVTFNLSFVVIVLWFLANVNSSSCSLYVIDGPSVVCLSVVCNVGAPYSDD